jgi:hypothetical protein
MRFLLEILRIVSILLVFGGLLSYLTGHVYATLGFNLDNSEYLWLIWIAILLLLFVFYRNRLQFSGWYKGEGMKQLPKPITFVLIGCSIILFTITPFLD